jgi:integrase
MTTSLPDDSRTRPAAGGSGPIPSVAAYLERWLAHARARVRVRALTYEGYEALLRRHALPRLGNLKLDELSPLQIQDLYRELLAGSEASGPLSAGTVLNLHLVLTQAFGQAVRWQLLAANPVAGTQPPRPRRAPRLLVDPALLARLLASVAGSWLEAPAAIAAATGMRRGEALGLRWADLADDLSAAQVQRTLQPTREGLVFESPKTARSRRTVLLPDFLRPYLERQRADQDDRRTTTPAWQELDLVVDRGDGRPLNPDTLSTGWARHLRRAKLPPVRFHDLRHAHATLMLVQGVHPKVVSERLGHASIGITLDTYSHVLPTLQQEAVAAFDSLFPAQPG